MNNKLLFILMIVIYFISGCNEPGSIPNLPFIPDLKSFDISGTVKVDCGSKLFPLPDAVIRIENLETRTDLYGGFTISGLKKIKSTLHIYSPYIVDFDTTIHFKSSYFHFNFTVESSTHNADFWPLAVGNKWIFDYRGIWGFAFESDRYSGIESWEISEKNVMLDRTQYKVRQIFSGICEAYRVNPYPIGTHDSLTINADTTYFDIIHYNSEILKVDYKLVRPPCYINLVTLDRRFIAPVFGDTLDYLTGAVNENYSFRETYIRDVGPYLLTQWTGGNHQNSYYLKLIDYQIHK